MSKRIHVNKIVIKLLYNTLIILCRRISSIFFLGSHLQTRFTSLTLKYNSTLFVYIYSHIRLYYITKVNGKVKCINYVNKF